MINSTALNRSLLYARCMLLATAAAWEMQPLAYAAPTRTNQVIRSTTSQTLRVPLSEARSWHALKYNSRPPHTLHFAGSGLETSVRQSAMPLLWPLPQFQTIINQLDLEIFYDNRAADPDLSR